jgi:peptide-methionine (S)-S-oxide reductase
MQESLILGGGCFWCLDAVYRNIRGVSESLCGYAGGHVDNPSYEAVCGKKTGHIEVVRVAFDPAIVTREQILAIFFTIHDPTTRDRQGADVGPQYRSVIFFEGEAQKAASEAAMAEAERNWGRAVVTDLLPAPRFWLAEPVHQDYFARNPWAGYCQAVVAPKVAKARKAFAHLHKEAAA